MYQDCVGGVQFWGHALVSGSGDGLVRMWDSKCFVVPFFSLRLHVLMKDFEVRTGQVHRTLAGHTAPVSCLQFDELHIMSGSLDKTIRVRASPSPSPSLLLELYLNLTCLPLPSLPPSSRSSVLPPLRPTTDMGHPDRHA